MPVLITFNVINANYLADNALLFNGENQVFGWNSHLKQSNPLYSSGILNPHAANVNILIDRDFIDYVVYDPDVTIGASFEGL